MTDDVNPRRDAGYDFLREADTINARIGRQIETQEREREETAKALHLQLERLEKYSEVLVRNSQHHLEAIVGAGDESLRQHIADQVGQIRLALEAGDKLVDANVSAIVGEIAAIRREHDIVREAADRAVTKSETSVKERLMDGNRFREQILEERGQYALREAVAEQIEGVTKAQSTALSRLDRLEGERRGVSASFGVMIAVATVLLTVIIIAVNVLTTH